jgi:hypothetical protein
MDELTTETLVEEPTQVDRSSTVVYELAVWLRPRLYGPFLKSGWSHVSGIFLEWRDPSVERSFSAQRRDYTNACARPHRKPASSSPNPNHRISFSFLFTALTCCSTSLLQ